VARSALVAGGIGILSALLIASILSALPVVGVYLPTGLWGLADQLAVGSLPDPLIGPVVAKPGRGERGHHRHRRRRRLMVVPRQEL
jgi:hypothetical protein